MMLITGGCSFSTPGHGTWVDCAQHKLKPLNCKHTGASAASNQLIQRRVIFAIEQALQHTDAQDITVMVMWSGHNRDNYLTQQGEYLCSDSVSKLAEIVQQGQMRDCNNEPAQLGYMFWTPTASATDAKLEEKLLKYSNEYNSWDIATHSMLALQYYCQNKGVNYYWCNFTNDWRDFYYNRITVDMYNSIGWLYDQLDHASCISEHGMYEWVKSHINSRKAFYGDGFHPSPFAHSVFFDQVMLPYIQVN